MYLTNGYYSDLVNSYIGIFQLAKQQVEDEYNNATTFKSGHSDFLVLYGSHLLIWGHCMMLHELKRE